MENTLELWKDLFTDPVAIYSAIGFIIMLGIGGFFLWFFMTKSSLAVIVKVFLVFILEVLDLGQVQLLY